MWPFSKKQDVQKVETKSHVLGVNDVLGSFLNFGSNGASTASSALSLYSQSTAVSIPVNLIAEAFASIKPVIQLMNEDDRILTDHPILDLLRKPSPFYTKELFFEALAKHYLVTNNAYVIALGNINRPPLELQVISPSNANAVQGRDGITENIIISGNTLPGSYVLMTEKMNSRYLAGNLRELKQIRGFSVRDNSLLTGQSPLMSASDEVRQHIMGNTHNVSLLEKGGRVSLVFHFKEDMSKDDHAATEKKINSKFGGADKAGSIITTAGESLEIKEIGINNKDMDFALLQSMSKQAVALQYKVPLPLVTIEATSFNNYREAKLALYDDAALPLADRIYGGLTNLLMPRYDEDPAQMKITYDLNSITALSIRRNEQLRLRKELNIEAINEIRKSIGLEPDPNGDQILVPATLVPLGSDPFARNNQDSDEIGLLRDKN